MFKIFGFISIMLVVFLCRFSTTLRLYGRDTTMSSGRYAGRKGKRMGRKERGKAETGKKDSIVCCCS
jgi:hypothetical protein